MADNIQSDIVVHRSSAAVQSNATAGQLLAWRPHAAGAADAMLTAVESPSERQQDDAADSVDSAAVAVVAAVVLVAADHDDDAVADDKTKQHPAVLAMDA